MQEKEKKSSKHKVDHVNVECQLKTRTSFVSFGDSSRCSFHRGDPKAIRMLMREFSQFYAKFVVTNQLENDSHFPESSAKDQTVR